jgi:hypothetical protein
MIQLMGPSEHGHENSGSIRSGEFIGKQLSTSQTGGYAPRNFETVV